MHRSSLAETLRLSDLPACVPPRCFSSSLGTRVEIDCLLWACTRIASVPMSPPGRAAAIAGWPAGAGAAADVA